MSRANEKMHSRFVRKGGGYERRAYITFSSVVGTSTRRCYTRVYNILKRAVHVWCENTRELHVWKLFAFSARKLTMYSNIGADVIL